MIKNRAIKVVSALLLLYAFVGFVLPPFLLKPQVVKLLDQNLEAKSSIGSLFFNPFTFRLTLSDVALSDKQTHKNIISFAKLSVNLDPTSLIVGKIDIEEFLLQKPYVHLVREHDKQLNLTHLVHTPKKKKQSQAASSKPPKIHIGSFAIEEGVFEFDDQSLASEYHVEVSPIFFRLADIDTAKTKEDGLVGFYAKIGLDGYLDVDARIHSVMPFVADGTITLQANQLYEQWRYVRDFLSLEVADGHLSFDGSFSLDQTKLAAMQIKVERASLQKLRIKPKNAYKDVLTLGDMTLQNAILYPLSQKLSIESIALSDLYLKAKRDHNGQIDWQEFVQTSFPKEQADAAQKSEQKPWQVSVKNVQISNVGATFKDSVVTPSVITTLTRLDASVEDFVLGSSKPFRVQSTLRLNDRFVCHDKSQITQKPLQLTTDIQCQNFDITHYNPYIDYYAKRSLKRFDLDLKEAVSDLGAQMLLREQNATMAIEIKKGAFALRNVKIAKKSTRRKLLSWDSLQLANIEYDSTHKSFSVADTGLKNLHVSLARYKNNKLNFVGLVEPKKSQRAAKSKKESSKSVAYLLKKVHIDNAAVAFMDKALTKPTRTKLHHVNVTLKNVSSDTKSPIDYTVCAVLNTKGKIKTEGKVRQKPLHATSRFSLRNIALADFSPYVEEMSYARIADGQLSIEGKALYAPSKKHPDLDLKGDLHLWDFAVAKSGEQQHIFQLANVGVKDFVIQTVPNRAYVNEIEIDGLYADAYLDANKTLNFAKLIKKQPQKEKDTTNQTQKSKPFPFTIAKIAIANSNAMFADYSLPIKFKTEIHELQGGVYAVSNDPNEVSFIDLTGAVDQYGSMKLKGSVQSADPKEFTDIEMHFRNLDMSALSGYTAEFAGYKIKNGKLFVDLKYKIEHAQMLGENALLIKNIELGEEIEDENVTHLPLGLAIALLEDSDGVIDIEMPVEGNVDAPDFKYGRVVLKALANLIVKAVASPFKFLGSALGINAEELASLEFEYGSAVLMPSEREKLDKMAKILTKRPKIAFVFTPTYDHSRDAYALKLHGLVTKLLQESKIKSDEDLQNALSVELLEEVFLKVHKEDALKKMQQRLHRVYKNNKNIYKVKYREALLRACVAQQPLSEESLIKLAEARFEAVERYLVEQKGVLPGRIMRKKIADVSSEEGKFAIMKVDITLSSSHK